MRLQYPHVVSTLALFVAIGGTAVAVDGPNPGQNTIGSEDIIGDEVKSDDIGNGRIFNVDIADNIIQSQKIRDGTITGADVDESTFDFRVQPFDLGGAVSLPGLRSTTIGDLRLGVKCDTYGARQIIFTNLTGQWATVNWSYGTRGTGNVTSDGWAIPPGDYHNQSFHGGQFRIGEWIFSSANSRITVNMYVFDAGDRCEANGTATYAKMP